MATTYVDIQDRYFIKTDNTNDITINVIIGDGQTGAYVIFEDKKLKAANKSANLKTANKLVGKRCLVAATIVDMMNATNWTSVTVEVQDGNKKQTYGPYSKEAPIQLDTIGYTISIYFQNPQP